MPPETKHQPQHLLSPPDNPARAAEQLELANRVFNVIHSGVLVSDADGYILYFNEPYGRFLGVDPDRQIGRHVTDVIENTRMHIVAQTGRAEVNVTQHIQGREMVVQRIPVFKDGRVAAVFGQVMFQDVRDVRRLARKLSVLETKVKQYEAELTTLRSTRYTLDSIKGVSSALRSLKEEAAKAAGNKLPVLITGESGTGKELFAQAIHHAGRRRMKPFIRINCAAIPRELFESELFGYARGAFTGALSGGKPGKFELADGGTVFLDEIGEMPMEMQPKLLRVLEEKEFERVGGVSLVRSDFRLIAATNQNLEALLAKSLFRKDLFYRLNVIPLHVPPLRQRPEDVMPLAYHLLEQLHDAAPGRELTISPAAEGVLSAYHWPGNARELTNVLERTISSLESDTIRPLDLPYYLQSRVQPRTGSKTPLLKEVVAQAEKNAIAQALEACGGNKAEAARILGVHRTLIYKKMHRYGLMGDDGGSGADGGFM